MTYATVQDIQDRLVRTLGSDEQAVCTTLLEDAAVIIDAYNADADTDAKKVVSCRMVIRAIGTGSGADVPIGATQGSMSALGYSQSWTIGTSGAVGELYLAKIEKILLRSGNSIGSYSPVQELAEVES